MEIWHRVAFNAGKAEFLQALIEMGVAYEVSPLPGTPNGLVYFDILESDPHWPRVDGLIRTVGASNMFDTRFTPQEILKADWSRLTVVFEQGYPQPKANWKWLEMTYDNPCSRCGVAARQKAPFRIAKEPRMGKKDFMGLYWTWTTFVTKAVVRVLDEAGCTGYQAWPPILHKSGIPSEVVTQLVSTHTSQPALADEDKVRPETCPNCGALTYAYHKKGYMHLKKDALPSGLDFVQIYELFGSGGATIREVLVSNRVARLMIEKGWRGFRLKPVELI